MPSSTSKLSDPNVTNLNKYICVCKKSYAHRSSYYKHSNTCLTFQHHKAHKSDVSVTVIDEEYDHMNDTITSPVVRTNNRKSRVNKKYIIASTNDIDNNNNNNKNKNIIEDEEEVDLSPPTFPSFTLHSTDNYTQRLQADIRNSGSTTKITHKEKEKLLCEKDIIDHTMSELLTEQNEKIKEYIQQMMAVISKNKKRSDKSLVNSLVFELLDQNKTLQKQIIELSKERNIVVNNTNNNQFNLNFFLNEQCKDAINMTDFVNSLEITLDDLTYTRNQGLVEGISKVMIDGLKQMDLYKRPIHCTDQKRDTIYIKDNHTWARDEGNIRMKKAFVDIANKEYFAIKMWMDSNPEWESNSTLQDFHHKMVKNVLHEIKDDPAGERRILKNIERETFIEK
jgi:hypothetical protein